MNLRTTPLLLLGLLACTPKSDDTEDSTPAGPAEVSAISARQHQTIESIVYVAWEQTGAGEVWIEFSADGQTWLQSPPTQRAPGSHEELLLGIPYDSEATYRVVTAEGASEDGIITTGVQPEGVPTLEVLAMEAGALDPDTHYVLGSIDEIGAMGTAVATWSFVFDRNGEVVWAWETPAQRATIHARVAKTGTEFLLDYGSYWAIYDGGAESQVARLKIDGSEEALYDTPGLHHPFTDTPDGTLYYAAHNQGWNTLRRLNADGTTDDIWGCEDFYDKIDHSAQYCAANTVTWDDATGHVLFSLYSSDSVIEIDPQFGTSLRWFGHIPGAWSFDPEESAFWWQHGIHYTEDGTLLVSSKDQEYATETVVREYDLDEDNETLVEIWSFGEGEGVYGPEMGEAHRLGNGNTLHNYGSGARVREVTPAGEVVWDLTFSSGTYLGRTTPIEDLYAFAP